MSWRFLLTLSFITTFACSLQAQESDEHPRWFKKDQLNNGQYVFYCRSDGNDEKTTLASARGNCLEKMCYLFGEQIEVSTTVEETLTDTKINTKIVNACPKVRIIERKEKRKSVDCFEGQCSAFIMQTYPEKEYKKEWQRLNRPKISPKLQALLKSAAKPPPEKKATSEFTVKGNIQPLWDRGFSYLGILLDGKIIHKCTRDNLDDNCNFQGKVPAGQHIVGIYTFNRYKHSLLAKKTVNQIYWFPANARVVINLDQVSVKQEKDLSYLPYEKAIKLQSNSKYDANTEIISSLLTDNIAVIDSCQKALWSLSTMPTCSSKDVSAFKPAISKVKQFCLNTTTDLPSNKWADRLMKFTEENISQQPLSHCYSKADIKYMPYAVKQVFKDMWPVPYDKITTWSWARSLSPNKNQTLISGKTWQSRLQHIENSLPDITNKIATTEALIALFNAEEGEETKQTLHTFIQILAQAPFDLDPISPYGHFNHYLLNKSFNYKIPRTTEFSERLANYIQTEPKIHCGNRFYAYYVLRYFEADRTLSETEKAAIQTMIKNSPSKQSQRVCQYTLKKLG